MMMLDKQAMQAHRHQAREGTGPLVVMQIHAVVQHHQVKGELMGPMAYAVKTV